MDPVVQELLAVIRQRDWERALIHGAAVASLSWFVLTVVLEHVLVSELEPTRHTISEYANAPGAAGPLMVAGFLMWAAALAATALLVARSPVQGGSGGTRLLRNALFALLLLAASGAILTALFPTQTRAGVLPPGPLEPNAGPLHAFGSDLIQACFYPAVLVSLTLPTPRWFRILALALFGVAVAIAPALAVLGVDASGGRQRIQLAAGCGWQFALLAALRSAAADVAAARAGFR